MKTSQVNITDLKVEKQNKVDALITSCKVFFAFSNEQFTSSIPTLEEGDKIVSMGAGGYLPKSQVQNWIDGMDAIGKWYKGATKSIKLRKQNIAYELSNHEAYYTGDISDTLDALGEDYTRAEVLEVFYKERRKQAA